jgi:ABC-type dipeptide/oligopeptide/nickel transport system permease subunit
MTSGGLAHGDVVRPAAPRPAAPLPPGPWRLTLNRLRRDRASVAAAVTFGVIVVLSFAGGPIVSAILGHNSTDQFPYAVDENFKPAGPWSRVPDVGNVLVDNQGNPTTPPAGTKTTLLPLGADGVLGRDELLRLLDGGKTTLEVAIGGVIFALLIGVPIGCIGGYFGGFPDAVVSRLTEVVMAFPLILFLVFASVRLSDSLTPIGWGSILPPGVFAVSLLIGVFTSFYPLRLVRGQLLVLRDAEFVQASHMTGASSSRILRRHLFPHLVPILLVWGAIAVATNILLEVGISFIGAGIQASTPTWGSMLSTTWGTIYSPRTYNSLSFTPWQTIFPTLAILLTVVSLNQLSEGVRRAVQPWSST